MPGTKVKTVATLIVAVVSLSLASQAQADVIRQWDFNSLAADSVQQTGTRRPNNGYGAVAQTSGGVGNRFGVVATANQPADPNSFDNSHWRIGQIDDPQTGTALPETGFPAAGNGNKTAGAVFPVNTSGYANIRVSWNQENSATASRYWRVQYTVNGVDWIDSTTVVTAVSTDSTGGQANTPIWQHGLTADFTGEIGVDDNPNFAFRIVSEFESTATGAGVEGYVANRAGSTYTRGGTMWLELVTVEGDSFAPENQWPVVSPIADQVVLTNEASAFQFTISDAETSPENLVLSAFSSDPTLISSVSIGGSGSSRTVTVTPAPGRQGLAAITIRARDEGGKVGESAFEVLVTSPSILPIPDQTTTPNTPIEVFFTTTNMPGEPMFDWTLTGGSSDQSVVPDSGITFSGPNVTSSVTITPASEGSTIISVTNTGAGGRTAVQTFELKVLPHRIVFFDLSAIPSIAPEFVTATLVSNGLSAGPLERGSGIQAAGLTRGFSANNWNNTNSTTNPVLPNRENAIAEGEHYQFGVTVEPGYKLSLASIETSLRRSAVAAPMNFEWQYSFDGFTTPGVTMTNFNYFGRSSGTAPSPLRSYQWMTSDTAGQDAGNPTWPFRLDHITDLQNVPAGTTVTFRLYAWGTGNGADSNTLALGRNNGPALRGVVHLDKPAIAIRRSGSDVIISWPASAADYVLQSTTLTDPNDWAPSAYTPVLQDGNYVVTITAPSGSEFFRLAK